MKYTPSQDPARQFDPAEMHGVGYALAASALLVVATVAAALAVSHPVAATGAGALVVAGGIAARTLRRYYRTRRRTGRTRRVCVPKTGVCVEV